MLTLRVVSNGIEFAALELPWQQLYADAGCALPFQHFAWHKAWWEVLGQRQLLRRDQLMILTVYDQERLVGVAPFFRTVWGFAHGFGFSFVRPLGSDPNITEIQALLALPRYQDEVLDLIARHLEGACEPWDFIKWCALPLALTSTLQRRWIGRPVVNHNDGLTEVYLLPLPSTWLLFAATLKRNVKESIRKCYNAPARDQLDFKFDCLSEQQAVVSSMPRFFELHALRAEQPDVVPHPNVFAASVHRDFLIRAVSDLSGSGHVRMFRLCLGERVIAMRLAFIADKTLYLYFSGCDPAYSKYSIMTRMVVEIIKYAIDAAIATINLSPGRDVSKTRWRPQMECLRSYTFVGPSLRSRGLFTLFNAFYRRKYHASKVVESADP